MDCPGECDEAIVPGFGGAGEPQGEKVLVLHYVDIA
jgi:hypothetical protein